MLSPDPTSAVNNTSIISATKIGDISITKETHATPERERYSSGGKVVAVHPPAMEKIKEEYDENHEYADARLRAQKQTSDYNEMDMVLRLQKDSMRDFTNQSFMNNGPERFNTEINPV